MALEDIKSAIDDFKDQLFLLQSGYDKKEDLQEAYGSFNTLIGFLPQLKNTNEYSSVNKAFKSLLSVKGKILKGKNLKKLNEYGNLLVAKAIQEYRKIEDIHEKAKEKYPEEKEIKVKPISKFGNYLNILKGLYIQLSAQLGLERPAIDLKKTFDDVVSGVRDLVLSQYKEKEIPEKDWEFIRATEDVRRELEKIKGTEKPDDVTLECLKEYCLELDRFIERKSKELLF